MPKIKENSKLSLEKAFSELDQIVHDIEDDSISLDEMIALFEQGMLLTKICNKTLINSEIKLISESINNELKKENANNTFV